MESQQKTLEKSVQAFALALQCFSSKAYEYVREMFNLGLPHLVTLRKWCSIVDGRACLLRRRCSHWHGKQGNSERPGEQLLCTLMIDDMAIKKHIEYDGERYVGFGMQVSDSAPLLLTH